MFNSPQWASLIDVKIAAGVVQAVSRPRLAAYGLTAAPTTPTPPLGATATGNATLPSGTVPASGVGPAQSSGIQAVAGHGRNITLCEATYPVLHMLEVVMRNSIHNAFRHHYGADDWYDQGWLTPGHTNLVAEAKATLTKRSRPIIPDRVIAELSFGFWCGMFTGAYESASGPWPTLLTTVLPRVPKSWRTRPKVKQRVEEARDLRNRVFHHEPITHHHDLLVRHRRFVELLGWFSPDAREHIQHICRFNKVFADRLVLAPPPEPSSTPATPVT